MKQKAKLTFLYFYKMILVNLRGDIKTDIRTKTSFFYWFTSAETGVSLKEILCRWMISNNWNGLDTSAGRNAPSAKENRRWWMLTSECWANILWWATVHFDWVKKKAKSNERSVEATQIYRHDVKKPGLHSVFYPGCKKAQCSGVSGRGRSEEQGQERRLNLECLKQDLNLGKLKVCNKAQRWIW